MCGHTSGWGYLSANECSLARLHALLSTPVLVCRIGHDLSETDRNDSGRDRSQANPQHTAWKASSTPKLCFGGLGSGVTSRSVNMWYNVQECAKRGSPEGVSMRRGCVRHDSRRSASGEIVGGGGWVGGSWKVKEVECLARMMFQVMEGLRARAIGMHRLELRPGAHLSGWWDMWVIAPQLHNHMQCVSFNDSVV